MTAFEPRSKDLFTRTQKVEGKAVYQPFPILYYLVMELDLDKTQAFYF